MQIMINLELIKQYELEFEIYLQSLNFYEVRPLELIIFFSKI
jgi:hypothetical protein